MDELAVEMLIRALVVKNLLPSQFLFVDRLIIYSLTICSILITEDNLINQVLSF